MNNIVRAKTERHDLGRFGERVAIRYLLFHGYLVRRRGYMTEDGNEVDLIATNREYVIFVEVKTRLLDVKNPNEPRPASAVFPDKQRSVIAAARHYAANHPSERKKRLDIIEIYVSEKNGRKRVAEIKHLKGAFNVTTAFKPH